MITDGTNWFGLVNEENWAHLKKEKKENVFRISFKVLSSK